jgi:hypothetical protein
MFSVIHVVYTFCFIICVTDGLQPGKDDTSLWLDPTTCQNLHFVLKKYQVIQGLGF